VITRFNDKDLPPKQLRHCGIDLYGTVFKINE